MPEQRGNLVPVKGDDAHDSLLRRNAAGVFVVVLSALIYFFSAAKYVLGGDNGEFLAVAHGGIAHPSGYPLYTMYLRLMTWLPGTSPAHSAALATAFLGVATVALTYVALRRWGSGCVMAAALTLLFALSPRFWLAATHAEVFMLNALIAAAILGVAAPCGRLSLARGLSLCLLAGLGLSNHLTIALLMPIGVVAVWKSLRATWYPASLLLAPLALATGLVANLYLLVAGNNNAPWSWGAPSRIGDVLRHVLRLDYGMFDLGIANEHTSATEHIGALGWQVMSDLAWVPAVVLATAFLVSLRGPRPRWKAQHWALVLTVLTTGPLFVARFNLSSSGLSNSIVQRFYLLPELVLLVLTAVAANGLSRRWGPSRLGLSFGGTRRRLLSVALLCGIATAMVSRGLGTLGEHHSPAVELYLRNTLNSVPFGSVIMGSGDHRVFGFAYLQGVVGVRPDVTYIAPDLLHYPWYADRIDKKLKVALPRASHHNINTAALAAAVLDTGRPLFLSDLFTMRIVQTFASYPYGTLIRIVGPNDKALTPKEAMAKNQQLYSHFDLHYPMPTDPESWAWNVQQDYIRTWTVLGQARHAPTESGAAASGVNAD